MPGGGARGRDRQPRVLWRRLADRRERRGWRWSVVRLACLPVKEDEEGAQDVHGPRGESLKLSLYSNVWARFRGNGWEEKKNRQSLLQSWRRSAGGRDTAWRTRIRGGSGSFRESKRWSRSRGCRCVRRGRQRLRLLRGRRFDRQASRHL